MTLEAFAEELAREDVMARLRAGVIGEGMAIDGPLGPKPLVYADYTASGRALVQVEDFIRHRVLPWYANSHTQASWCGKFCTTLREAARGVIADAVGAGEDCTVIFTGNGATAAINRLVALTGAGSHTGSRPPVVFIGPYEHHSNILPWRESGAKVVEIPEHAAGGPELEILQQALHAHRHHPLRIGSFSAASNVTGIITDVDAVTRILRRHGALSLWDFAAAGPYLPVSMGGGDTARDAVFLSPHKFLGGPGASGVLVVRNTAVVTRKPTWPGGGTVSFVSPWDHEYTESLAAREEAGTPDVIGDIRAALVFMVKAAIGERRLAEREAELDARALARWRRNPHLELLGTDRPHRLPIFSFRVRDGRGGYVHHQLFTRMLSDHHGIQARGGCACAGPYAHRLLGLDRAASEALHQAIRAGDELAKPGWVRLNLHAVMDDATVDFIIEAVDELARRAPALATAYSADPATARFHYLEQEPVAAE